jgi:hypothetical protein
MSMQAEGKDAKGRNYHQTTKDGTGSAASVGTGGTGDIGAMGSEASRQSASRTDDLLAGNTTHEEADQAFQGGSDKGQIQTGMEGIAGGKGNRQSGRQGGSRQGADLQDPAETDPTQYDQGTADRER